MKNSISPKPYPTQLGNPDVERVLRQAHAMRGRYFASVARAGLRVIVTRARLLAAWVAHRAHAGSAHHA